MPRRTQHCIQGKRFGAPEGNRGQHRVGLERAALLQGASGKGALLFLRGTF